MTAYVPFEANSNEPKLRQAILICPGGGYLGFNEKEMESVALQLIANGTPAFVLHYSIGAGIAALPAPIADMAKAVGHLRQNYRRYGIDPQRICCMGFSASCQCVALLGSLWHESWLSQLTGLSPADMMPNAMILGYPILDAAAFQSSVKEKHPEYQAMAEMMVAALYNTPNPTAEIADKWNPEGCLSKDSVPAWIWTLENDELVEMPSLEKFSKGLFAEGVFCEMNVFKGGTHGSGINFGRDFEIKNDWFEKSACIPFKPVLY